MKTSLATLITLFIFLNSTLAFSQKLTREYVNSKLTKSWTATEAAKPGEEFSPKRHKEIMDFKSDGSLIIEQYSKIMGNTNSEVLWGFDEANQKLIMTLPTGGLSETQELEIIELTSDKLVLMLTENLTVYIPTEKIEQKTNSVTAASTNQTGIAEGINPDAWSGKLPYNIVIMKDHYNKTSKERVPGLISLEMIGEKRIIRKKELGNTVTWTINEELFIDNITIYTAVCSDLKLNGEISFQNGFMLLEIYEPKYNSYLWAVE